MTYEETVKIISEFDDVKNDNFFTPDCMQKMKENYSVIISQITRMQNSQGLETTEVKEVENNLVLNYINILNAFTYRPIKKDHTEYISAYNWLIHNWNNNTINSNSLKTLITLIERIIESHFNMIEASNTLKKMSNYFSRMNSWMPQALDINKKYFDLMVEKNEDTTK